MDVSQELAVHEEEGFLVCVLKPGRSRTADDAVGFFLLPVLAASTVVAITYMAVYIGVALVGTDPAIALEGWDSAFFWLAGLVWVGSTAALWRSAPGVRPRAELKLDQDSLTLVSDGALGFYTRFCDLREAHVKRDRIQLVEVLRVEGEPLQIPMGGNSEEAASWVVERIRARIDP